MGPAIVFSGSKDSFFVESEELDGFCSDKDFAMLKVRLTKTEVSLVILCSLKFADPARYI